MEGKVDFGSSKSGGRRRRDGRENVNTRTPAVEYDRKDRSAKTPSRVVIARKMARHENGAARGALGRPKEASKQKKWLTGC